MSREREAACAEPAQEPRQRHGGDTGELAQERAVTAPEHQVREARQEIVSRDPEVRGELRLAPEARLRRRERAEDVLGTLRRAARDLVSRLRRCEVL